MDNYPAAAWERLGAELRKRRGQLGYGYRQLPRFAAERGWAMSVKTLGRLERGDRDTYPADTLAAVERLYGWQAGSVAAILEGGEAVPLLPSEADVLATLTPEERRIVAAFVETMRRLQASPGEERRRA